MKPDDGLPFVPDPHRSRGSSLVAESDGLEYLNLGAGLDSAVLGMNPPEIVDDPEFTTLLADVVYEPTGTGLRRRQRAAFVDTFARVLGDLSLPHLRFVEDGSRAVATAVECAVAWKGRHNARHGRCVPGDQVLQFGPGSRDPSRGWLTIDVPAMPSSGHAADPERTERGSLAHARRAFEVHRHDVACVVVEPVVDDNGDNHVTAGFLQAVQRLCHANDALLVLDEVRTGVGLTGTPWAYQQLGLAPDLVAFGDRLRIGGVMAGRRAAPAAEDVIAGGALVDMVHARRVLEVVETRALCGRAARLGRVLVAMLGRLAARFPHHVSNVRGCGLMCAFDLRATAVRDEVVTCLREDERVLVLPGGPRSIRLRAPLTVTLEELEAGVCAMHRVLAGLVRRAHPVQVRPPRRR